MKSLQCNIFMRNHKEKDVFYHQTYTEGNKVLPEDLEMYGYRLTVRYINITSQYKLFELLLVNSSRSARFCFLTPDHRLHGVIIPNSFQEHKATIYSPHTRSAPVDPILFGKFAKPKNNLKIAV